MSDPKIPCGRPFKTILVNGATYCCLSTHCPHCEEIVRLRKAIDTDVRRCTQHAKLIDAASHLVIYTWDHETKGRKAALDKVFETLGFSPKPLDRLASLERRVQELENPTDPRSHFRHNMTKDDPR